MHEWHLADRVLSIDRPLVMGIVNVTSDSFSDGGQHPTPDLAIAHALGLLDQGADVLDIGGESTRPGSQPVSLDAELSRVVPVVTALAKRTRTPLSIDTSKAEVARQCLRAGALIINDVTALRGDPDMAAVVRDFQAGVIVMHMLGTPQTMQLNPLYGDVLADLSVFFQERLQAAVEIGIAAARMVLDPGIGFGKTDLHNLEILARLPELQKLGRPICLGVSRKGFAGRLLGRSVEERLAASLAAACHAVCHGAAQVFRVHDVAATRDCVRLLQVLRQRETNPH
jgi:dihydropteroate synthase